MKIFGAIILIVFGLIPLTRYTIKEDGKTFLKIMIGASCGAIIIGGIIILMI